MITLRAEGASEAGLGGPNQDCFRADATLGLFAVADGLGGRPGGAMASALAIETLFRRLETWPRDAGAQGAHEALAAAIRAGHEALRAQALVNQELEGMSTTLVTCLVWEGRMVLGHVGDSRAYLVRGETVRRLTDDHSLANALLARGRLTQSEARRHPRGRLLVQALGQEFVPEIEFSTHTSMAGDGIVLCSDGVSEGVPEEEFQDVCRQPLSPAEGCARLIRRARARGSRDDATVVMIRVGGESSDGATRP